MIHSFMQAIQSQTVQIIFGKASTGCLNLCVCFFLFSEVASKIITNITMAEKKLKENCFFTH